MRRCTPGRIEGDPGADTKPSVQVSEPLTCTDDKSQN